MTGIAITILLLNPRPEFAPIMDNETTLSRPPATPSQIQNLQLLQRGELEDLIHNAVRSAVNEAVDERFERQTDQVLTGIFAAAGIIVAVMAIIAGLLGTGVWNLNKTVNSQTKTLGKINGFLHAAFPNTTIPDDN